MTSQSRARSRRFVSLRVSYDLKTGTFRMPAFVEIGPDEFIENPAAKHLQAKTRSAAQVMQLRIVDGGRVNG
jgi:hypothetical protein